MPAANRVHERIAVELRPGFKVPIRSADEASAVVRQYIERNNIGGSEFQGGQVTDRQGKPVAKVSYNGRVWSPDGKELLQNAFDEEQPKAGQTTEEANRERLEKIRAESDRIKAEIEQPTPTGPIPRSTWMNRDDIDQAVERYQNHPVLGPATRFLRDFRDEVDDHSDGWPYWKLPSHAAAQLMGMIQHPEHATEANFKKVLGPIRAFYTKRGNAAGMQFPKLEGTAAQPKSQKARKPESPTADVQQSAVQTQPVTPAAITPVTAETNTIEPGQLEHTEIGRASCRERV